MPFKAGNRYNSVCIELGKKGITREEIAEKLGIRYNSTVKYYPMKTFSPAILRRLERLKEWGINPLYFEDEKAEMFLATPKETEESLMVELLKEVKQMARIQEQLLERTEEQNQLLRVLQKNGDPEA